MDPLSPDLDYDPDPSLELTVGSISVDRSEGELEPDLVLPDGTELYLRDAFTVGFCRSERDDEEGES